MRSDVADPQDGDAAAGWRGAGSLLVLQVVLAAALPWVVGVLLRPDSPWWGILVLAGVAAFAALHRQVPRIWALAASAAVSLGALAVDPVPTWYAAAAGVTAIASALLALLGIRGARVTAAPRAAAAIGWALVAAGVLTAGLGALAVHATDEDFNEGQAVLAAQFEAAGSSAATSSATPAPPAPTGTTEGPMSPLVGPVEDPASDFATEPTQPAPAEAAPSVRPPLARLEFRRPGSSETLVTDGPLYVGPDVTAQGLAAGPGHYPQTALPGRPGNVAIAGHRTGWGSPFLHLDDLAPGDEVVLTTPDGEAFTYAVDLVTVVAPDSPWVLEPDPIGTGPRTLTLTTCDPPGTAEDRLVVFATLRP